MTGRDGMAATSYQKGVGSDEQHARVHCRHARTDCRHRQARMCSSTEAQVSLLSHGQTDGQTDGLGRHLSAGLTAGSVPEGLGVFDPLASGRLSGNYPSQGRGDCRISRGFFPHATGLGDRHVRGGSLPFSPAGWMGEARIYEVRMPWTSVGGGVEEPR